MNRRQFLISSAALALGEAAGFGRETRKKETNLQKLRQSLNEIILEIYEEHPNKNEWASKREMLNYYQNLDHRPGSEKLADHDLQEIMAVVAMLYLLDDKEITYRFKFESPEDINLFFGLIFSLTEGTGCYKHIGLSRVPNTSLWRAYFSKGGVVLANELMEFYSRYLMHNAGIVFENSQIDLSNSRKMLRVVVKTIAYSEATKIFATNYNQASADNLSQTRNNILGNLDQSYWGHSGHRTLKVMMRSHLHLFQEYKDNPWVRINNEPRIGDFCSFVPGS